MPPPPVRATADRDDLADKLALAGRGDANAFADVYDHTAPRVFGLALRVIGDPDRAEEIAQGAYVDIWREAGRFDRTQGSALAWMMSLAHRRAVECVRSTRGACRPDVLQDAEPRSTLEAWSGLSGPQQRVVELAYLDGHTHGDVSTLLPEQGDDIPGQMGAALRSLCRQS